MLNSLKGGVVPRIGLPTSPWDARSRSRPAHRPEPHSRWRRKLPLLVGRYGAGKSFAPDHPYARHG
ncbi:MAG: hypothetical protein ACLTYW_02625 [Collinsella sp.]